MKRHRAMALLRWVAILAILAAVVLGGFILLQRYSRPAVTVTTIVEGPVVQAFYATGTLLPEREFPIKANASGILLEVLVDKGDRLTKDQPLAVVYEDGVQFRLEQARAEREQKRKLADVKTSPILSEFDARISAYTDLLEIAKREEARYKNAVETKAGSALDLDRAADRVKTVWVELERAKAQKAAKKIELDKDLEVADSALKIASWNLDRQTIRCPIDNAAVLDRPATVGTRLNVNDHIMQVADVRPDMLIMRAAVDEEDKTSVWIGQTVQMVLYSYPNRPFKGKVKKIYDKAEAERRTFEVDVEMTDKDKGFSAGMTAELAFIIDEKPKAMVIPRQALQGDAVWVVRDGQLARVEVKPGLKSVERAEIISGLRNEDHVVISAMDNPEQGQRVRATYIEPKAAADLNRPTSEGNGFKGFR